MSRCTSPWVAPLIASLASCGAGGSRPQFEAFDLSARVPARDYPGSPAVILLDRGELRFGFDAESHRAWARLRRWRRVQVLREQTPELKLVEVPEDPSTLIRGLRVRVIRADGVHRTMAGATRAVSRSGQPVLRMTLPELSAGAVIETIYDTWFEDPRFLPPWRFDSVWPTERSEYAAVVPIGIEVDLRFSRDGAFVDAPPDRFETKEGVRFAWSLSELPPRWPEPETPAPDSLAPRAHVHFIRARGEGIRQDGFETWDDVGGWLLGRAPGWETLDDATRAEAIRVAGEGSDLDKALSLFNVVATRLEPETDIAPPAWRAPVPHPASVLKSGRANPTSRGLLLASLLRGIGVSSQLVLYANRGEDILLPDLPAARSLDGLAVTLPGPSGPVFLDPSHLTADARVPPPHLQGGRAVVLDENGARTIHVPISAPSASRTEIEYALLLTSGGDLSGQLTGRFTGAEGGLLRAKLKDSPPEHYAEALADFLQSRASPLRLSSVQFNGLKTLAAPLEVRATLELPAWLGVEAGTIYIPLSRLLGAPPTVPSQVRRSPRALGAPRETEATVRFRLPSGWKMTLLPTPQSASGPGFEARLGAAEVDGGFEISFRYRQSGLEVPQRAHADYRDFQLDWQALAERTVGLSPASEEDLAY
ncbi:MAG: hypothetical protein AAFZ18_23685 [Myxococcota bacterium]